MLKYLLLAGAGNSYFLEVQSVWYLQYQLHYFVDPRVAASLSYSYDCSVIASYSCDFHSSFVCRRKDHRWVFGAIVRECYILIIQSVLFTRCWPWRGFNLYFVIVNRVAPRRCGCLCYLILIYRNRTVPCRSVPSRLDRLNKKQRTLYAFFDRADERRSS